VIELLLQAERALEMGRVDAAEGLYRQVAENDPRNSIAVVGLARVTLERGDEAGALTLARRALAIDPENAAAVRMVTRLEEVLAYRGEALPDVVTREPQPELDLAPATEPASASALEPEIEPVPEPEPTPGSEPASSPPRRRSLLDRLLRRNR